MLASQQPNLDPKLDVRQRCLFRGNSCFPLSPKYDKKNKISSDDQLIKIMEVLPDLSEDDTSFVKNLSALKTLEAIKMQESLKSASKLNEIYSNLENGPYSHLFTVL